MSKLIFDRESFEGIFIDNSVKLVNKNAFGFHETDCDFVKNSLTTIMYNVLDFTEIFDDERLDSLNNIMMDLNYG